MTTDLDLLYESNTLYAAAVEMTVKHLDAPTVCAGYSVLDLISHHVMTLESFAAPIDGGPGASFDRILAADDVTAGDPVGATRRALVRVHAAYTGADPDEVRTYNVGPVPVGAAMKVLIMQNVIHAWDLARVVDADVAPSDDLLALCEAVAAEFVPAVPFFGTPQATDRTDRFGVLLAYCGRTM